MTESAERKVGREMEQGTERDLKWPNVHGG